MVNVMKRNLSCHALGPAHKALDLTGRCGREHGEPVSVGGSERRVRAGANGG